MTLTYTVDALRGRFHRYRGTQQYSVLAKTIGLSARTLNTFARGSDVGYASLRLIEKWCAAQEEKESANAY